MRWILTRLLIGEASLVAVTLVACLLFGWTTRVEFGTAIFVVGLVVLMLGILLGTQLSTVRGNPVAGTAMVLDPGMEHGPNLRTQLGQLMALATGVILGLPPLIAGVAITWTA